MTRHFTVALHYAYEKVQHRRQTAQRLRFWEFSVYRRATLRVEPNLSFVCPVPEANPGFGKGSLGVRYRSAHCAV